MSLPHTMKIVRGVAQKLSLGEQKEVPVKVQILRTGNFYDPRYGEFEITPAMLLSMKRNFDGNVRGVDLAMDYGHQSGGEAAGWFKSLELSSDGQELWATMDWTPVAAEKLAGGQYRYVSADFHNDYEDNETRQKHGPTLLGAGLTNRPVIKGMDPAITLQERKESDMKKTVEELQTEITTLTEQLTTAKSESKKLSDAVGAPEGDGPAMMKKIEELQQQCAQLAAENQTLKESAMKATQLAEEAKAEKAKADKTAAFDKLMSEGKVVEAQREAFMSGDAVKLAELSSPLNLGSRGHGKDVPNLTGDAADRVIQLAEARVKEGKSKTRSEAIQAVLMENKELRAKYEGRA